MTNPPSRPRPHLVVSACLLGEPTRYDGQLKRDPRVADELGAVAELRSVCPEVGIGLAVPREPIQLEGEAAAPRMVVVQTGEDLTAAMERWLDVTLAELDDWGPDGVVLKGRSPSCGLHAVPVFRGDDGPHDEGTGLFALAVRRRWPSLPMVEAEALEEPTAAADFLAAVRARARARC